MSGRSCELLDHMSYRRRLKNKKPPEGWELIEEVIEDFEQQMKEAVNEEHEGKRKAELTWKIHRIHWEKNRFVYDLMYQRKVMSRDLVRIAFPKVPARSEWGFARRLILAHVFAQSLET